MSAFGQALSANFQEPSSPDQTSTPPVQIPSQQSAQTSPLAAAIARSKKKQKPKQPATLAAAIAKARSAKPSSRRFG